MIQQGEVLHECKIDEDELWKAEIMDYRAVRWGDISTAPSLLASAWFNVEVQHPLAREVINSRELLAIHFYAFVMKKIFSHFAATLYHCAKETLRHRRKKTPMDVEGMVKAWIPLVRQLAVAHNVDERDVASSQLDDLLIPIIAAPIVQIREFYRELIKSLKEDPTIPWAVWRLFEFWGSEVLDKITVEQEVTLKTEIAKRIAESSVQKIPVNDWVEAMAGALQWRDPATLTTIESSLAKGAQPRVRGKESCLFLQVEEAQVLL